MNLCKWGDLPVNLFTGKQFILEGLRLISIVTIGDNSTMPPCIALKLGHITVGGIPSLFIQKVNF